MGGQLVQRRLDPRLVGQRRHPPAPGSAPAARRGSRRRPGCRAGSSPSPARRRSPPRPPRRRRAASAAPAPAPPCAPCGSRSRAPARPTRTSRHAAQRQHLGRLQHRLDVQQPEPVASRRAHLPARGDRRSAGRASGSRRTGPAPSRPAAHGPGCRCPSPPRAGPRGRPASPCCPAAPRDRCRPAAAGPAPARAGRRRARPPAGRDRRNWRAAAAAAPPRGSRRRAGAPTVRRELGQAQDVLLGQVARPLQPGHHPQRAQARARLDQGCASSNSAGSPRNLLTT